MIPSVHAESNATAINIKNFVCYNLHIKLFKKTPLIKSLLMI